ncbi:hypothetical protein CR513_06893, partial [Mucuna pruriens]
MEGVQEDEDEEDEVEDIVRLKNGKKPTTSSIEVTSVAAKKKMSRGIKLVDYIYNHSMALNTMWKFTNKSELVRHGVTRFAVTFLTLQRLHKQKANHRRIFTSNKWVESRVAKDPKGKKATDIALMLSFWNVVYALRL